LHYKRLNVQALEARKTAKLKRVYYDLEDMIKTNKDGQTPYTPVLPLLYGMQASMKLMRAEGFENVIKRHHRSGHHASGHIKTTVSF